MKQPVDRVQNLFMIYNLAAVGLLDTPLHACDEAGLIFQHAGNGIFHQLFGVLAVGRSHFPEPRLDVGGEM